MNFPFSQEKSFYSDCGDMEYSNNGFESSGILDASMHSTNDDKRHVEDNLNELNTNYGEYVSTSEDLFSLLGPK